MYITRIDFNVVVKCERKVSRMETVLSQLKPETALISLYTPRWRNVRYKKDTQWNLYFKNFCFLGRGLTIVGSILEGDFKERADDVALAKEVGDTG